MKEKELDALCTYWQSLLGLKDWDIVVSICSAEDMAEPKDVGNVYPYPSTRQAMIKIVTEEDFSTDEPYAYDPESILVHELLHLLMWRFTSDRVHKKRYNEDIEIAINVLEKLLINQHRKTQVKNGKAKT